jgi:hypothetical protein
MLRPCRVRIVPLVCFAVLTATAIPASAAKWAHGCPKAREKLKRIDGYGTESAHWLFVHVGHDIILHNYKWPRFSIEPDGNTIEITFLPLGGGAPIPLAPFTATAVSASTLQFPAPDTRPTLGRLVVGPMKIVVKVNGEIIVDTIRNPTLLPPMNDMRALTDAGGAVEALGTLSPRLKSILVPFTFEEYGPGDPLCGTAELSPIQRFAADFTLKNGPDEILPNVSFAAIKKARLWFGDYTVDGAAGAVNLYGQKLNGTMSATRIPRGGVVVCALNDTYELIMSIKVGEAGFNPASELLPLVSDGSPLVLNFRNISADADVADDLANVTLDGRNNACLEEETYPTPTAAPTPTATP